MKTIICTIIIAITSSVFIAGCGQSVPMGNDPVVKETVIRIARQEFRNKISRMIYIRLTGIYTWDAISYDNLASKASKKDVNAKKAIAAIDSAMAQVKMSLTNIRIDRIDDKIRKSYSSADLHVDETSMPIKYTAQRNADGKVYVEVTGLNF